MKVSELLTNARARVANPLHWTQGVFATVRALDSHAPISCTTPGEVHTNVGKYGRDHVVRCCGVGAVLVELPPEAWRNGLASYAERGLSLYRKARELLDAASDAIAAAECGNNPPARASYSFVMLNDSGLRGKPHTHELVLRAFDHAIARAKDAEAAEVQS